MYTKGTLQFTDGFVPLEHIFQYYLHSLLQSSAVQMQLAQLPLTACELPAVACQLNPSVSHDLKEFYPSLVSLALEGAAFSLPWESGGRKVINIRKDVSNYLNQDGYLQYKSLLSTVPEFVLQSFVLILRFCCKVKPEISNNYILRSVIPKKDKAPG